MITSVAPGSVAAEGGVRQGDVIASIEGAFFAVLPEDIFQLPGGESVPSFCREHADGDAVVQPERITDAMTHSPTIDSLRRAVWSKRQRDRARA